MQKDQINTLNRMLIGNSIGVDILVKKWPIGLGRVLMIFYGLSRWLAAFFSNRITVLTGNDLHQLHGVISVSDSLVFAKVASQIFKLKPFLIYKPVGVKSALRHLTDELNIDAVRDLSVVLNGNSVLVLFGSSRSCAVVIHCGIGVQSINAVLRHKAGLELLERFEIHSRCRLRLPRIIDFSHSMNCHKLIQERMAGLTGMAPSMSEKIFEEKLNRLIDFSLTFAALSFKASGSVGMIESIRVSLCQKLSDEHFSCIEGALQAIEIWSIESKHPPVLVHGDLWLGNGLFDSANNLISVIDWEWADESGIPLYDAMHCLIVSTAIYRGCSVISVVQAIWKSSGGDDLLSLTLRDIEQRSGVTATDLKFTAAVIWLSIIKRTHVDTGPASRDWLKDHLWQPAQAFSQVSTLLSADSDRGSLATLDLKGD